MNTHTQIIYIYTYIHTYIHTYEIFTILRISNTYNDKYMRIYIYAYRLYTLMCSIYLSIYIYIYIYTTHAIGVYVLNTCARV